VTADNSQHGDSIVGFRDRWQLVDFKLNDIKIKDSCDGSVRNPTVANTVFASSGVDA
jgi:hypothetical protein